MNEEKIRQAVRELVHLLDPDPPHARQVCRLSLGLYDQLVSFHHLPDHSRALLQAGALLHDIGWSVEGEPHHKASRDLILSDTTIPFRREERVIVALIARYHRRSKPDPDHALYRDLPLSDRLIVQYCAAFLRIADALDRSHRSLVTDLSCSPGHDEIRIICRCRDVPGSETRMFAEKSDLLRDLTRCSITLVWI